MLANINSATVRKIAVLRANALGDFIFVLPALKALRQTFVNAEIVYLGQSWHKEFIPGRVDSVDRVVAVPPYPGVGSPEGSQPDKKKLTVFFKDMQSEKFDLAFQMHGGGGNSNPFLKLLGARLNIGLAAKDAPKLDITIPYIYYHNEFLRYLEVAAAAGARTAEIVPRVTVLDKDRFEAATLSDDSSSRAKIVLHPGATDPRRRWAAENFAAVASKLIEDGFRVFITGSGSERQLVQNIIRQEPQAISTYQKLSVGGLTGLLEQAVLVISNDTGPLHLASAVGTKTVGLYWVGNQIMAGQLTRTNHRPLLSWTVACPVCATPCVDTYQTNKRYCNHEVSFIDDISLERVLEEAYDLL